MKNLLIILAAFFLIGCSSAKTLTQTTDDVYNQGINYVVTDTAIQQPSTAYYPSEDAYTAPQINLYVNFSPDYRMWSPYWYAYSYPYYYSPWYYGYPYYHYPHYYNYWHPYYGFYAPHYYPYGNYWNYNHYGWYGHHYDGNRGYYYGRRPIGTPTPQPNRNDAQPPQQRVAPKPQPKYQRTQTYSSPAYRQAKSNPEYMRTAPAPRNIQENQKVTPSNRSILYKPMEGKNNQMQRNYNAPNKAKQSQPQRVAPSHRSIAPNNNQRQNSPPRQSPQNMRR